MREIIELTGFKCTNTFYKYVVKGSPVHRYTGKPMQITPAQVEQAKALYAAGELPVKKIMTLTGFKCYNTFYKYVVKGACRHTRMLKEITPAQVEQAKALYAAGELSVREIIELTGFRNPPTFYKYVVKGGTVHHHAGRPIQITPAQIKQAKALYAAGELSVREIIELTGFKCYNTFYKYM